MYASLEDNINVIYHESFLNNKEANYLYNKLEERLKYNSKEESKIFINGRYFYIPREQAAYGDVGTFYKFS